MTNVHTCVICNNAFARLALYSILKPVTSSLYFFNQPDREFYSHAFKEPHMKNVILAMFDNQGRKNSESGYVDLLVRLLPGVDVTVLTDLSLTPSCWRNGLLMLSRKASMPAISSALRHRLSTLSEGTTFRSGPMSETLLTAREMEVLKLWYCGFSMTRTAQLLGRSVKTVSSHKRTAMLKLSVSCNQALYFALAASGRDLTDEVPAGKLR